MNLANQEKFALMQINKKGRAGGNLKSCGTEPPNFFTWTNEVKSFNFFVGNSDQIVKFMKTGLF